MAEDEEVVRLKQQLEMMQRQLEETAQKVEMTQRQLEETKLRESFEYWHCFNRVWNYELQPYEDYYKVNKSLRQNHSVELYSVVHNILVGGEGIELVLQENAPWSVFSYEESNGESQSIVTRDPSEQGDEGNRSTKTSHEKNNLKTMLGGRLDKCDVSRAHAFPNDKECNKFWWPMFQLVTGSHCNEFSARQDRLNENQQDYFREPAQPHL
mmetsp:Transcript_1937/g.4076  ORF Transcript_1937/g.4076 Transcript_1937/m.4076 type:complete len:211 (+) Transcript_1937:3-635(+)